MPCACKSCLRHSKTLGVVQWPPSKAGVRKAYRAAAKLWHPDRFEKFPAKRFEAEERFKQIQVAYRELWEHCEHPEPSPVERTASTSSKRTEPPTRREPPPLSFGGARGCYAAPHLPPFAVEFTAGHLEDTESALGIVDLSGAGSEPGSFSQYIFMTNYRVLVRDALHILSIVWYTDLGEISLIDRRKQRKPGIWQKIIDGALGPQQQYSLQILRRNGNSFCSLNDQVDDSVKKVIYNFLLQMKSQQQS